MARSLSLVYSTSMAGKKSSSSSSSSRSGSTTGSRPQDAPVETEYEAGVEVIGGGGRKSSSRRGREGKTSSSLSHRRRETDAGTPAVQSYRSHPTYNSLVILTIAVLALSIVNPTLANLSCKTDADCSVKGKGFCKQHSNGEATCVYTSCKAGFWGAGNTYTDCFECPSAMTSLAGKAFYNTDCFVPCGESRCYMPEDGYTECGIEPSTAVQACFSTCNRDGFIVANPDRPYATCVPDHQVDNRVGSPANRTIVNQGYHHRPKVAAAVEAVALPPRSETGGNPASTDSHANPKLRPKRSEKRSVGRRLRKGTDLASGHGPAVAMLEHAGEDPLALVSK